MTRPVSRLLRRAVVALAVCTAPVLAPGPAEAVPFGFACLTQNQAASCQAGQQQLRMDVSTLGTAGGTEFVLFEFQNAAQLASSVTDIYMDDALGNGLAMFYWIGGQSAGVDYDLSNASNASPANPPGAATIGFAADYGWDANSGQSGTQTIPNGLNAAGEWLRLVFALQTGTFDSVISALTGGTLRVALNVQGFAGNTRGETFVNRTTPTPTVPEPASLVLLGSGLAGAALARRRRPALA